LNMSELELYEKSIKVSYKLKSTGEEFSRLCLRTRFLGRS
jgi:hypothetical protein